MGWFSKKEKKEVPSLPKLPKLPELPKIKEEKLENPKIHQLPSFPTSSLGEKFSQDTIKEAVTGKKEGEGVPEANDFAKSQMMPEPLKNPPSHDFPMEKIGGIPPKKTTQEFSNQPLTKKAEPVFIRIDKFEESLKIFDKAKNKISEVEKILKEIKTTKAEEERELDAWEGEIEMIKKQIEKVDKNIFSKI